MAPGSDIDARGVTFSRDRLTELLNALRDPQGHPQIGTADFINATFTDDAEFGYATFAGDADFRKATFTQDADFGGASIAGDASFIDATFTQDAVFSGATFERDAVFARARFIGDADFGGASIAGDASFIDASFAQRAGFIGRTFARNAIFYRAVFTGEAVFASAKFIRDADFRKATFIREAEFLGATFGGDARFVDATFTGNAGFGHVTFSGSAFFASAVVLDELLVEAAAEAVDASSLRGAGRVSLRLRAARIDLTDVVLTGPVSVHGLDHPIEGVDETAFADGAGQVPPVRVVSVRGVDAAQVTMTDVDLSQCRFAGLQRADQIVLDGRCVFASGPRGRRRVLAEEHHWRAARAGGSGREQDEDGWQRLPEHEGMSVEVVGPARLEVLYRQLRKALEDAKNEPGAADFYYGEMEMRRAAVARRAERWLLGLYWAILGYGLRARRALVWLMLLAVLSISGLASFGFPQTAKDQKASGTVTTPAGPQPITLTIRQSDPVTPMTDRVEKATEVTLNGVIFRNPDADLTTGGRYLNISVRILGPILLGLTILAIRNQVKR